MRFNYARLVLAYPVPMAFSPIRRGRLPRLA